MKYLCEKCKQDFDDPAECSIHEKWCGIPEKDIVHIAGLYIDFRNDAAIERRTPVRKLRAELDRDILGLHWNVDSPFFAIYNYIGEDTAYERAVEFALGEMLPKMQEYREYLDKRLVRTREVEKAIQDMLADKKESDV